MSKSIFDHSCCLEQKVTSDTYKIHHELGFSHDDDHHHRKRENINEKNQICIKNQICMLIRCLILKFLSKSHHCI